MGPAVRNIEDHAFWDFTALESVNMLDGVTSIGNSAFSDCKALTSITLSNQIVSIGERAFDGCSSLETITLPATITTIGSSAFYDCTGLRWVTSYIKEPFYLSSVFSSETMSGATLVIPFGTTYSYQQAGGWEFSNVVEMEGSGEEIQFIAFADPVADEVCLSQWDQNHDGKLSIAEAKKVTAIGGFEGKTALTSYDEIKYFTNATTISGSAFYGCVSLKSIALPGWITTIGENAFRKSGLQTLTIPASVTSIGASSLAGKAIHVLWPEPVSVSSVLMQDAGNTILYVPKGSVAAYEAANGWKEFYVIEDNGATGTDWTEGSVTVNVETEGQLNLALAELDETSVKRLVVRGRLNATDIKYLRAGKGKIAALESLDLRDVTLVASDESYYSKSYGNDVGLGSTSWAYFISDVDNEDSYQTGGGILGMGDKSTVNNVYSSNLAAAFNGLGYKHVVMPRSIRSAGASVFADCKNLQEVEFPGGLREVFGSAFEGCEHLLAIDLSDVEHIEASAFEGCRFLQNTGSTAKLKKLGSSAFESCGMLGGTLSLAGVDSIPERAFAGCPMLEEVQLSDGLKYIGPDAFNGCSQLSSVNLPAGLKSISATAFVGTPWLKTLPVDNGIRYFGTLALAYDRDSGVADAKGAKLGFREGTTDIADRFAATIQYYYSGSSTGYFYCGENVEDISLPASLRRIGDYAFGSDVSGKRTAVQNVVLPDGLVEIGIGAFSYTPILKVTVPEELKLLGNDAFKGCSSLSQVVFNAIDVQGASQFANCSTLSKVTVGPKVKRLPDEIFSACPELMVLKFDDRTTAEPLVIGERAFVGTGLLSVKIPAATTVIGKEAFIYCGSLEVLTFEQRSDDATLFIGDNSFAGTSIASVMLPKGKTEIGSGAFYEDKLETVGFQGVVTKLHGNIDKDGNVGSAVFGSNLTQTNLVFPDGLTYVGHGALNGLANVTSIDLGGSVKSIGQYAFANCPALKEVKLGEQIDSIAGHMFSGSGLERIVIPASVEKIGNSAFYRCQSLSEVVFPSGLISVGDYAFGECSKLSSVELPEGVESIGNCTFQGCPLTEFVFPSSVDHIGYYVLGAYYGSNPNLQVIESRIAKPFEIPDVVNVYYSYSETCPVFHNWIKQNVTLRVPQGTMEAYKNTYPWSDFVNIEEVWITPPDNTLVAESVAVLTDDAAVLTVGLNNKIDDFVAYQFDLELPAGVEIAMTASGQYDVAKGSRYTDASQSLSVETVGNNVWRIVCLSLQNGVIKDSEGALLSVRLLASENMAAGEYKGRMKNVIFTQKDGTRHSLPNVAFAINVTVSDMTVYDTNNDGTIDVADAVVVVNCILNNSANAEYDVNGDGEVDVFDVTKIIGAILSGKSAAAPRKAIAREPAVESVRLSASGNSIGMGVERAERFTAFQFCVEVPEGVTLAKAALTGAPTSHQLQVAKTGDNVYTVVGISLNNELLPAAGDKLIELQLAGKTGGEVCVSDIVFVDTAEQTTRFYGDVVDVATGIASVGSGLPADGHYYTLDGRRAGTERSRLSRGIYIINNKKVIIK